MVKLNRLYYLAFFTRKETIIDHQFKIRKQQIMESNNNFSPIWEKMILFTYILFLPFGR